MSFGMINTPNNTSSFTMDGSNRGVGGNNNNGSLLPSTFNKIDPFGRFRSTTNNNQSAMAALGMSSVTPFPLSNATTANRGLPSNSFTSAAATMTPAAATGGGIQQSLNMLCNVAAAEPGGANKRSSAGQRGDFVSQGLDPFKRRKVDVASPMQNPKLLERLSSLGGGFPMPKWAGAKKIKQEDSQLKLKPSLGSFPMPGVKEQKQPFYTSEQFSGYKTLWHDTDQDLRKEVFARRLCKASTRVVDGKLRHGSL